EEKVLPSVVIEVVHAEPPAGEPARAHQQTRALAVIFETAAAREITEQKKRIVQNTGDDQVRLAIIIEVAKVGSHAGDGEPIVAQGHSGFKADLAEGPV